MRKFFILSVSLLSFNSLAQAGIITHSDYTANSVITAAGQNANENNIYNEFNGNIDNNNIKAGGVVNANIAAGTIAEDRLASVLQSSINVMGLLTSTQTWSAPNTYTNQITLSSGTAINFNLSFSGNEGTPGKLASSNGHAAPSWVAPSTVGGMVLLGSGAASGSSSVSFTGLDGGSYSAFEVVIDNVTPGTTGVDIEAQVSTGSGFVTSGYKFENSRFVTNTVSADGSTSATGFYLNGNVEHLGTGTNQVWSCRFFVHGSNITALKRATWTSSGLMASTLYVGNTGAGEVDTGSAVIDGIKFLMTSGTIATGTFYVYGLKAS